MKYLLIGTMLLNLAALGCSEDGKSGFAPANDMLIPAYIKTDSPITKASFFKVIEEVEAIYKPIMADSAEPLEIIKDWETATVNAYATKKGGKSVVKMFGGLARHPQMTEDGFALVVCHEIGHHIGGAPKKGTRWASNEGQSDYWATLKCARKSWANDDNFAIIANMNVPEIVATKCEKFHGTGHDYALCIRSSMAGQSLANTLSELRSSPPKGGIPPKGIFVAGLPQFDTPSKTLSRSTNDSHPEAQCRLDTYFMGAICDVSHTQDVNQKDPNIGVCSRYSLKARRAFSISKGKGSGNKSDRKLPGARPRCWYKPSQRIGR